MSISFSQNKSKEAVLQLMADDTCECIKDDPETFSKDVEMSKKEIALGICLIKSFEKRKSLSKAFKNKSATDEIDSIAEDIGVLMITTCGTEFMSSFTADELISSDEEELGDIPPPPPAPKNEDDFKMEAKLVSVHNEGISYIKVVNDFNKEYVFLIVTQFEGKDLLKQSNKDLNLKIYYKEKDFYDLSEQRYVKKRVLNYIERLK
ncbi:hypothetical protein [Lacinutrix chionoecetis]